MQYKNTKTGVIIDVLSVINGGDWVQYDQEFENKPEIEKVQENDENRQQEEVLSKNTVADEKTDNPTLDDITKADIMQELDAFGVKYDKRSNKQVLYDLMMEQGKE
ncbi:hypothetical protein SFC12_02160 [Lactococcus lactis]|uniref:hypothetical protein n=1 Tax=Lactococcus lactis TaxID=1358 RepID=UPI0039826246